MLLAHTLPVNSAWQAMYLLQSILLFLTSCVLIHVAFLNKSTRGFFIASLILLLSLHFADPVLEGPSAFPSSSVFRFFWCYIIMYIFYLDNAKPNIKFIAIIMNACWIFGCFWSAESAIYSTCAFLPAYLIRENLKKIAV